MPNPWVSEWSTDKVLRRWLALELVKDLLDAEDLVCPDTVSTNTEATPCLHLRNLSAHKVSALHMEGTMVELWALVSSLGDTCG